MNILYLWSVLFLLIQGSLNIQSDAKDVQTYKNPNINFKRDISQNGQHINFQIKSVPEWPNKNIKLGQVSGVALDSNGNVFVFHRGPRIWDKNTFNSNDIFVESQGPIVDSTVAVIHPHSGELLYEWGREMFYLPHGITVDHNNNVWTTDVAMHQVFKFPPIMHSQINNTVPLLTLGTRLQPGSDINSFCKPTAVAVMLSGEFFVSDGYCNSRIIKYSPAGTVLLHWGRDSLSTEPTVPAYHFFIPHDLTLIEDKNLLCVSDRENGRIQCFFTNNGTFVYQIQSKEIGSKVFSASYTSVSDGLLFIINGPSSIFNREIVHGSVIQASTNFKVIKTFQPNTNSENTFKQPHDIIVSPNGTSLYVAELYPFKVWKFNIEGLQLLSPIAMSRNTEERNFNQSNNNKTSGTILMAIFITAIVLCFGAVLLTTALLYSRTKNRGCSGHCKNDTWLVGRSTVDGFKLGNFLGQQHQGFIKLNNFEESDEDDSNVGSTFA